MRTERVYYRWFKRFIQLPHDRHPTEMGAAEIEMLPSGIAGCGCVSVNTQKQALSALMSTG
ncbi:phage integrase N-terminal SAM-like domain-containing protein [Pseudomonas sp. 22526]|uniref:phage integrase N-terminal SAM-like domain-containing protein n=1 Tax=Pseudomonas sp. 22526 TaxID=3453937 RepID=UPI003F841ADE